ncbi:MAG: hypothetical protein M0P95_18275 [Sulfuritalea sp.]|nr:hypothetical protein [Sulfuritalea sp.]
MHIRILLAGLAVACSCATAQAGGEHERRLAAELTVIAGDTRRLMTGEAGPLERDGLVKRLNGALSSLPLLLRRTSDDAIPVASIRALVARRDWRGVSAALATLKHRHPFDARQLLVAAPTPEMLSLGASIHQTTCAGCHDVTTGDTLLPAKNLATQLRTMPREEFAARLLLGVHGDRTTRWSNPFSNFELSSLIAHYSK